MQRAACEVPGASDRRKARVRRRRPDAVRNPAAFYDTVARGDTSNETITLAADSALVYILGREAAARRTPLTMAEVLKENHWPEVDLRGLNA